MRCPYCGHSDSKVIDSRDAEEGIRRRRECLLCGLRFTTYERIQAAALWVVKRDGRREEFNREKLLTGLRLACAKRPLPLGAVERVAEEIEGELQRLGRAEVPSATVGELVMERLKRLDRVAYIRFASVYRDFADVEHFRTEVETLAREQASGRPPENQPPLFQLENGLPSRQATRRPGRPRKRVARG